jgi:hypothetical protein
MAIHRSFDFQHVARPFRGEVFPCAGTIFVVPLKSLRPEGLSYFANRQGLAGDGDGDGEVVVGCGTSVGGKGLKSDHLMVTRTGTSRSFSL